MRVVVDTNVVISGIFFGGVPGRVLEAWRDGLIELVVSSEVLDEYRRVGERLEVQFPGVSLTPFLALVVANSKIVEPDPVPSPVSRDPNDDPFIACAVTGGCDAIVSGDRHLLEVSGYGGIDVLTPRQLLDRISGDS